jgi:23S rRNA (guanosine2251-2'-O)-methyltransferase
VLGSGAAVDVAPRRDHDIVYGRQPVAEAERGRRGVRRVWRAPATDADELTRMAGSPDHQGVVAEVDPYPYADADAMLAQRASLIVALDQVQDPHNLGAVARSAEVAGATGLVIPSRRSASVTPAAAKASAGAVEHLAIAQVTNLADWLLRAKDAGSWIYGADAAGTTAYVDSDLTGKVVLVLGSEGAGLRRLVAERCDVLVSIPVRGRVDSLNVSASAAVLLFEAARQRTAAAR